MGHRFLRKDYDVLVAKIEELGHGMWESGQEKALWADQSAETWHGNFGYEQEQQHQWALSERAEDLIQIESCERKSFVVGSYQVLDQQHENEISYAAPLAKPFMGATVGEEREVEIGDSKTRFRVVGVD